MTSTDYWYGWLMAGAIVGAWLLVLASAVLIAARVFLVEPIIRAIKGSLNK